MEQEEIIYWKRNVPYTIVVRRNALDRQGVSLNNAQEWMAVPASQIRDFKIANKAAIIGGLIIPTETPDVEFATPNSLTVEAMDELLKNYLKLKNTLSTVDSLPILSMLLERAKEQNKSTKMIAMIQKRFNVISGNDDEVTRPEEMQGVY